MNKENMYTIGNMSVEELANTYSTPLYIYDQNKLESRLNEFHMNFKSDQYDCEVLYASKAFSCKAMLKLANQYQFSLDVVSGGELYTAKAANFPMEKVYFHGNNKSYEELSMALDYGVGCIILDNMMETDALLEIAKAKNKKVHTMLRVNPGVEAHTHKYIVTAHLDSKFGISITRKDEIAELIQKINASEQLSFDGFHAHIGSQIFDENAFVAEIKTMMSFIKDMEATYNISTRALDLGGGFAAYYTDEDHPIPVPQVCAKILETFHAQNEELSLHVEKIMIEPGRSIVAEAGMTLYTVGYLKETKNKNYIFVNGGMNDNIRPALYQAKYDCILANKMNDKAEIVYTVAGKCCESGDILIEDIKLPKAETGDLLLMYTTGAYGYSMASNYNRIGKPGVVFVKDGKARLVVKKESYDDLIHLDCDGDEN